MPAFKMPPADQNENRRIYARLTLSTYLKLKREKPDVGLSDIVDLMTDLLHLAEEIAPSEGERNTPQTVANTALMHHKAETL